MYVSFFSCWALMDSKKRKSRTPPLEWDTFEGFMDNSAEPSPLDFMVDAALNIKSVFAGTDKMPCKSLWLLKRDGIQDALDALKEEDYYTDDRRFIEWFELTMAVFMGLRVHFADPVKNPHDVLRYESWKKMQVHIGLELG